MKWGLVLVALKPHEVLEIWVFGDFDTVSLSVKPHFSLMIKEPSAILSGLATSPASGSKLLKIIKKEMALEPLLNTGTSVQGQMHYEQKTKHV
jgi:hypothetical protein